MGLEPISLAWKARVQPIYHIRILWWTEKVSNLRRKDFQSFALPTELSVRMVPRNRLELLTFRVWTECSSLLSYRGILAPSARLELATYWLTANCSPIWANWEYGASCQNRTDIRCLQNTSTSHCTKEAYWRTSPESNWANLFCRQAPNRSVRGSLAGTAWLEPVTSGFGDRYSTNWAMSQYGSGGEVQTLVYQSQSPMP